MKADQIQQIKEDVGAALQAGINATNTVEFYRRILVQAVLTHGGELVIDPSLGDAAKKETRALEIGNGGARLINMDGGGL